MGADTFMVGKVGDDAYGRELMASLARHGVVCSNVSVSADEHTGIGLVMRGEGDNRAVYDPGANATITYKEVRAAIHGLAGKDNVFLCQLGCDLEATMQSHPVREAQRAVHDPQRYSGAQHPGGGVPGAGRPVHQRGRVRVPERH
jgi:sugar/nucleoside kinase (ribokinase family)